MKIVASSPMTSTYKSGCISDLKQVATNYKDRMIKNSKV